jgi:hypothetical protein
MKAVNFQRLLLFGSAKPKSSLSWGGLERSARPKPRVGSADFWTNGLAPVRLEQGLQFP